ncbi:hypothetical protein ACTHPH_23995 [Paenibacillus pasadenensis]|uniref:hypothetical protein n=1 Tax=Paenibacillus pasadenensis TaxID=217090 RepID=UPI00048AD57A|nr:hypothetical protein [Paenibacillus pasadenensis]
MVKLIEVAQILERPHLEPETIRALNAFIRRQLEKPQPQPDSEEKARVQSVVDEWVGAEGVVRIE